MDANIEGPGSSLRKRKQECHQIIDDINDDYMHNYLWFYAQISNK